MAGSEGGRVVRAAGRSQGGRSGDERGAALVEFVFAFGVMAIFLSGIITFGIVLAAKQTITQAASEGARAAVTEPYTEADLAVPEDSLPVKAALAQAERSLGWLDRTCDADGDAMECEATLFKCPTDPGDPDSPLRDCISVTVIFDYKTDPIIPVMPFIDAALPDTISATAVVALEGLEENLVT